MVRLNRLALRLNAAWCKLDHHARFQDTRLNTTDMDSPNARDLGDVLQRKTQRLLNRTDRLLDVVKRLMERRDLVPPMLFDCSIVLSPLKPEMRISGILSGLNTVRFRNACLSPDLVVPLLGD